MVLRGQTLLALSHQDNAIATFVILPSVALHNMPTRMADAHQRRRQAPPARAMAEVKIFLVLTFQPRIPR